MALYRFSFTRFVLRWRSFSQGRATGDECGVELPFKKRKGTEEHPDGEKDPLPEWPGSSKKNGPYICPGRLAHVRFSVRVRVRAGIVLDNKRLQAWSVLFT